MGFSIIFPDIISLTTQQKIAACEEQKPGNLGQGANDPTDPAKNNQDEAEWQQDHEGSMHV